MGLNPQQQEAVNSFEGPLLILAGAGSGKTTVLMNRIAKMIENDIKPYNILAVTFTNKAANEMKERINHMIGDKAYDIWMSTFHSMCLRILQFEIQSVPTLDKNFSIYDTNASKVVVRRIMKELDMVPKKGEEKEGVAKPDTIYGCISKLKNEMIDVSSYIDKKPSNNYIDWEKAEHIMQTMEDNRLIIDKVYPKYQEELVKSNAVDFDDLILKAIDLFMNNPTILEKYQDRFKYIMVDEYQDTNHAQYILINLLAQKYKNIAVVGDDFQSIYRFRGAEIRNILNFDDDFTDTKIIKLEQNYRSTKTIIQAANEVIKNNTKQKSKTLFTDNNQGEKLKYFEARMSEDEAHFLGNEIDNLARKGYSYNDIAILYRSNAQSGIIETILNRKNIANQVVGGTGFWDRMEIMDVVAYLQLISNPNSTVHFDRIVNKPKRGIGKTTVNKVLDGFTGGNFTDFLKEMKLSKKARENINEFIDLLEEFVVLREKTTVSNLIDIILKKTDYKKVYEKEDRNKKRDRDENLNQLINIALEMEEKEGRDVYLHEFMEEVVLRNVNDNNDEVDEKVTLMTIHASKGLEFPIIFIVGMNEGTFPAPYAETFDDQEEERRICYVAFTRAKELLYLSHPKLKAVGKRNLYGEFETKEVYPSRFLNEFDHNLVERVFTSYY